MSAPVVLLDRAGDVAALPDLRIVAATSTGYDHLELEALAAGGVWATDSRLCDEEVAAALRAETPDHGIAGPLHGRAPQASPGT